jgi:competence protein ComEC
MKKLFPLLGLITLLLIVGVACQAPVDRAPDLDVSDISTAPFAVHFLDVGNADAAVVTCAGQTLLIDGGNTGDSSLLVAYLKKLNIDRLDYVVCTHAHEDHAGGLAGPLNVYKAGKVFATDITYDSVPYQSFLKAVARQGLDITVPTPGESFHLGNSTVQFIGPVIPNHDDLNESSIVLRVVFGETSFLFTGDAGYEAEHAMLEAGYELGSTVLKVGHHGSNSSTSYVFLREVLPAYAVISVGADNPYGHPSEQVLSRLRDAGTAVYRTDLQGDVSAVRDGHKVTFRTGKNANIKTNPTEKQPESGTYIGNINSKVFHLPSCANLPSEKNRIYFAGRREALAAGYTSCGNCKP